MGLFSSKFNGLSWRTGFTSAWDAIGVDPPYEDIRTHHYDPGEYHYFATFVVSLGQRVAPDDRPVYIARLWADGEIIYDIDTGLNKPGVNYTFFDGSENQGVVYRGMHYRGQMTLLFKDMDLNDYGNNIPAITAELIDQPIGSDTAHKTMIAYDPVEPAAMQLDAENGLLFTIAAPTINGEVMPNAKARRIVLGTGVSSMDTLITGNFDTAAEPWPNVAWFAKHNMVFATTPYSYGNQVGYLYRLYSGEQAAIASVDLDAMGNDGVAFSAFEVIAPLTLETDGVTNSYVIGAGVGAGYLEYGVIEVSGVGLSSAWSSFGDQFSHAGDKLGIVVGEKINGTTVVYLVTPLGLDKVTLAYTVFGLQGTVSPLIYTPPVDAEIQQAFYDQQNNRVICLLADTLGDPLGVAVAVNADGSTEWTSEEFTLPTEKATAYRQAETTADTSGGTLVLTSGSAVDTVTRIDLITGALTTVEVPAVINPDMPAIWDSETERLYLHDQSYIAFGVPGDNAAYTMEQVMRAYGYHVGYVDENIITANLGYEIKGYVVSGSDTYSSLASLLGNLYGFSWYEQDDTITIKSPHNGDGELVIDYVLPEPRVLVLSPSLEATELVNITRQDDASLPSHVTLSYFDVDNELKQGIQPVGRNPLTNDSQSRTEINLPLTANGGEIQALLYDYLSKTWASRMGYSLRVPGEGIAFTPVDVISFTVLDKTYQGVVETLRVNADFSVSLGLSSVAGGIYPAAVEAQPPRVTLGGSMPVRTVVLDIPDISPAWTTEGSYNLVVAAGGFRENAFIGATVELNTDAGWQPQVTFGTDEESHIGTVVAPVGVWAHYDELDTVNAIYVQQDNIPTSKFVTVSNADLVNGANLIAIGNGKLAELIQFGTAEFIGNGVWRLSNLLRGRFGTEVFMHLSTVYGAPLVFMDRVKLIRYSTDDYQLEAYVEYRSRNPKQAQWEVTADLIEPEGNSRRPYAPAEIRAFREDDGDLVFTWYRRARFFNIPPYAANSLPPLDETEEKFVVRIYSDETFTFLVREIEGLSGVTYSSSLQTADGFTGDEPIVYAQVHQITASPVTLGFAHDSALDVIGYAPSDVVLLGAVFNGDGALHTDIVLESAGTLAVTFDGGGSFATEIDPINRRRIAADMSGGGEMAVTLNEYNPVFIGAAFAGGGEMAAGVRPSALVGMVAELGGTMIADVVSEGDIPEFGLRYWGFRNQPLNTNAYMKNSRVFDRIGAGGYSTTNGSFNVFQNWTNNASAFLVPGNDNELIIGAYALHRTTSADTRVRIQALNSSGNTLFFMSVNADTGELIYGNEAVQLGSVDVSAYVSVNTFFWISAYVIRDSVEGKVKIAINGNVVVDMTGDTGDADNFYSVLPFTYTTTGSVAQYVTLVLTDGHGPAPFNDVLPRMGTATLYPNGDVLNEWTPSTGATAWQILDVARYGPGANLTGANGDVVEVTFEAYTGEDTPLAVQAVAAGWSNGGATEITLEINNGGIDGESAVRNFTMVEADIGEWDVAKALNPDQWGSDLANLQVKLTAPASANSAAIAQVVVEVLYTY